jgi:mycothiol synthase
VVEQTEVKLRPPTLDDLPRLVDFWTRIREAHGTGLTDVEVHDRLASRGAKVEENYRITADAGRVSGWVSVWQPEPTSARVFLQLEADPRERERFVPLLDWAEERAREVGAGRTVRIHAGADDDNEELAALLRDRGYELVRHFFLMEIDLAAEPAQPVWPDGISARPFELGEEWAVYDALIEAFEDHWDHLSVPFEDWREYFLDSSQFDPSLWFLAADGDEIAGFALCTKERRPNTGVVNMLGVRRRWRRRGLGTALLLHAFHEFRRRGRDKADLHVDADSLTGAVRLYEQAGMHVARRNDTYRKELS